MPVTIAEKQLQPLISSPAPIPIPNPALFKPKTMPDGRKLWVSAPMPDRLSIVIPISPYVYAKALDPKLSVPDFMALLGKRLLDPPFPIELAGKPKFAFANQPDKEPEWRAVSLTFGKRDSSVHFSRRKDAKLGMTVRLEMNPRKVGPKGFKELASLLAEWFDVSALGQAARLTRLDIAVDVVGVQVSEIVAQQKDQGKHVHYVGKDGLLETIYINRRMMPFKQKYDEYGPVKPKKPKYPAGKPLLKIYDRIRERASVGVAPMYGDAQITRIELVKDRWPKKKLNDLPTLPDVFAGTKVGYAPSQTQIMPALWQRYVILTRLLPPEAAAAALGLTKKVEKLYAKALKVPSPDFVAPEECWKRWATGIEYTGLNILLSLGNVDLACTGVDHKGMLYKTNQP